MRFKRALKKTFIHITVLALLFIIIFAVLFFSWFAVLSQKRALDYFEGLSLKSEQSVKSYLQEIKKVAQLTSYSTTVQEYMFETSPYKRINSQSSATDLMTNIMTSYSNIKEIAFIKKDGSVFQSSGIYSELIRSVSFNKEIFPSFVLKAPMFTKVVNNKSSMYDANTPYFLYAYPVYSLIEGEFSSENSAICLILCKLEDIARQHFNGFDATEMTVVLSEQDKVIFSSGKLSDQNMENISDVAYGRSTFDFNSQKTLGFRHNLEGTRWNATIISPVESLIKDLVPLERVALFFVSVSSLVLLIMMLLGMRSLSVPIQGLLHNIRSIDLEKKINGRIPVSPIEEIAVLSTSINEMLNKIAEITQSQAETQEKLYQSSISQKQAQLQYYRSQINPHFLYNTLECIRSMAQVHHINCIEDICISMSRMFRYSVSDKVIVTVENELTHMQDYFNVIARGSSRRYVLKVNVSEEAKATLVSKMILQPIVENSIQHGFESKASPCIIEIVGVVLDNSVLSLKVVDNGYGIAPKQVLLLNEKMQNLNNETDQASDSIHSESGIGLFNINKRLQLAYGGRSKLEISSKYGCFTCVEITIPLS